MMRHGCHAGIVLGQIDIAGLHRQTHQIWHTIADK